MLSRCALFLLVGFPLCSPAQTVTLRPHQPEPGSVARINATTTTKGGQMTIQRADHEQKGTMEIRRERLLERRILGKGAAERVEYRIVKDRSRSSIALDGPPETSTADSALAGATAIGFRDSMGLRRLFLKGRTAMNAEAVELAELEAYENRRWFVDRPVAVGDSWTIDPGFIRHLSERDIGKTDLDATATLKEIAVIDGEKTAVISMKIESLGSRESPDAQRGAGVFLSATATLHVVLDSMLDKRLILEGTLITLARERDQSTTVRLPMRIEVTKALVR